MYQRVHVVLIAEFAAEGGALTYARMLLAHLLERGFTVAVVAFGPHERLAKNMGPLDQLVASDNSKTEQIQTSGIGRFGRNPIGYMIEARKIHELIKDAGWGPKIILSSVCSPGRFLGLGTIGGGYIQIHHTYPQGRAHWLAGSLFGWLARGVTLIGVSSFLSTRFNRVWRLRGPRAFVTLPSTVGRPTTAVSSFGERENMVLTVGAVNAEKNPRAVIDLARVLRERKTQDDAGEPLKFVWLGSGPLLASMRKEVSLHGLESTVFFEGFQSDPSPWYQRARAYYQPSTVDSMPLAVLDAFRWGVPTFTSGVGGLPEMLGPHLSENVIDPLDFSGVASRILRTTQQEEQWNYLSSQARQRYQVEYSLETWTARIDDVINMVGSGRGLSRRH